MRLVETDSPYIEFLNQRNFFRFFFTSRKMNEKFKNNRVEKAQNQEVKHGYPNTGIKQQRYCHMNNPRC